MSAESARDYLARVSEDLPLFIDGNAPVAMLPNFRSVSREELLQDEVLWKSFVNCFRDVFGRADIWGEGFICSKCGKVFPIEEPASVCNCGGKLDYFHSEDELRQRLTIELAPPAFCTLMLSPTNVTEVLGFSLGFIGDTERLSKYIASDKHVCGSEDAVVKALGNCKKLMFFDETGIRYKNRSGVRLLAFLTRAAFERGVQEGINTSLTWTVRKSPIYKVCRALGYVDIFETKTGIVFLLLDDFIPFLKVMQNKPPMESARVLVQMFRLNSTQ